MVESKLVELVVAGSNPVGHPILFLRGNFYPSSPPARLKWRGKWGMRGLHFEGSGTEKMITQRNHGLFSLVAMSQILLAVVLFWVLVLVFSLSPAGIAGPERYLIYFFIIVMALAMEALYRYKTDTSLLRKSTLEKHRTAIGQTLASSAAVLAFLVATKDQSISRLFLLCFSVALYGVLFSTACVLPGTLARFTFSGINQEITLLLGPSAKALALKTWLRRKADLGIHTVGLICDESGSFQPGFPVLGGTDDFERVVRKYHVTQVILVEFPMFSNMLNHMTTTCERLGVRLLIANDLEEKISHPISYFEDDGLQFFGLRNEPLQNPLNRFFKRVIDITVSLPVVIFLLPLLTFLVWFFQRLQSPGPVYYSQPRTGLQNQNFNIIKFRTMQVNNDDVARQASVNDDRIYPAGRWFRKLSIDEFPQFINVLRGEMSVVGPRPHLAEHNEQFALLMRNYYVRKFVKPGITGLAQVNGFRSETKDNEDLIRRIEFDIEYLENWSLGADLAIIGRTGMQVLVPPSTAY